MTSRAADPTASTWPEPWPAPVADRPLRATLRLPGSKSITNRALLLAALADGPSRVGYPLLSRDTRLMAAVLRALGTELVAVTPRGETQDLAAEGATHWRVVPAPLHGPADIDCGLPGTVMRSVPPAARLAFASAAGDRVELGLDAAITRQRWRHEFGIPLEAALESLAACGIRAMELSSADPSDSWLPLLDRRPRPR